MLVMQLDPATKTPIYAQVAKKIRTLIANGTLEDGKQIPATRTLAKQLGVSRSTICRAYDELIAQGYAVSTQGGYTLARLPLKQQALSPAPTSTRSAMPLKKDGRSDTFDFRVLAPDPGLMPLDDLRKAFHRALHRYGTEVLSYGHPQGFAPLRELLAQQMQQHSMQVTAAQIVLTNGALNGADLIFKLLITPGSTVVVEHPTYASILPLLAAHHAEIIAVDMTPDGIDLAQLQQVFSRHPGCLLFTMANFQNPTGVTTSAPNREKLYRLCCQHQVTIIEDGFEEELKYFDHAIAPLKAIDTEQRIFYLGTFAKTLAPALRTGWIVAPAQTLPALLNVKQVGEPCGNLLTQAALAEYIAAGHYQSHLKRLHRIYRKRMRIAIQTLEKGLPPKSRLWCKPKGGYLLWLELTEIGCSEQQLLAKLAERGLAVTAGSSGFQHSPKTYNIRLSIAQRSESEIAQGLTLLCQTLNDIYAAMDFANV